MIFKISIDFSNKCSVFKFVNIVAFTIKTHKLFASDSKMENRPLLWTLIRNVIRKGRKYGFLDLWQDAQVYPVSVILHRS